MTKSHPERYVTQNRLCHEGKWGENGGILIPGNRRFNQRYVTQEKKQKPKQNEFFVIAIVPIE